jgi:hypothetical protein
LRSSKTSYRHPRVDASKESFVSGREFTRADMIKAVDTFLSKKFFAKIAAKTEKAISEEIAFCKIRPAYSA